MNKIESLEKLKELYSFTKTIKSQQERCILEKKHIFDVNFHFIATFDLSLNTRGRWWKEDEDIPLSLEEAGKIFSLSNNDTVVINAVGVLDINVVPDSYFSSLFDEKFGSLVQNYLLQEYSDLVYSLVKNIHSGNVFLC